MRKLNLITVYLSFCLVVTTMALHLNVSAKEDVASKAEEIRNMTWEELVEASSDDVSHGPKDLLDIIIESLVRELEEPQYSACSIGGKPYDMDIEEAKEAVKALEAVYNSSHQYEAEVKFTFDGERYNIQINIFNPTVNVVDFIGQKVLVSAEAKYWKTSAMDEGGVTVPKDKEFTVNGVVYLDENGQKQGGTYIPASELGEQRILLLSQPLNLTVVVHICDSGTDYGWISPEDLNVEKITQRVIKVKEIE